MTKNAGMVKTGENKCHNIFKHKRLWGGFVPARRNTVRKEFCASPLSNQGTRRKCISGLDSNTWIALGGHRSRKFISVKLFPLIRNNAAVSPCFRIPIELYEHAAMCLIFDERPQDVSGISTERNPTYR